MGIYVDPLSSNYSELYGYPVDRGYAGNYYGSVGYRDAYGYGNQNIGPYVNASRPGFFASAWGSVSPFRHTPLHQTPGEENSPYYNAIGTRPFDAFASGLQNYVIPGLAVGAAGKLLGANTGSFWGDIKAPFLGQGPAAAFGRGLGSSMASKIFSGLGVSEGSALASGAVKAAGALGGVAFGIGLPLVVAESVARTANYTVFDPYISTRKTASSLRENLYGRVVPGASGDYTRGGKGLGSLESVEAAQGVTRAGINDYTFNLDDYSDISNMLGKSGALDNTSLKKIADRVKSAAEQIKLIVQISKDPSIQKAVEELSKLQLAGAGIDGGRFSAAGQALSQLGLYASAAGTSVQKLMSGIGAHGQAVYSSTGMTPYQGQLAAGNIYAGFSAAYRSGLISEGMMARLGGVENATKTALSSSVTASTSPLMQMLMYNSASGKQGAASFGGAQTPTGIMSAYGQSVSQDPFSTMGMQILMGPQMTERFMKNDSRNIEQTMVQLMRPMGIKPNGPDGKYTIQQMAPFLQGYLGMSPEEVRNFATRRLAETDPETVALKNKSMRSQAYEETLQYAEANGLVDTIPSRVAHSVKSSMHATRQALNAYVAEPLTSASGEFQDWVSKSLHNLQYGKTVSNANDGSSTSQVDSSTLEGLGWTESSSRNNTATNQAPFWTAKEISQYKSPVTEYSSRLGALGIGVREETPAVRLQDVSEPLPVQKMRRSISPESIATGGATRMVEETFGKAPVTKTTSGGAVETFGGFKGGYPSVDRYLPDQKSTVKPFSIYSPVQSGEITLAPTVVGPKLETIPGIAAESTSLASSGWRESSGSAKAPATKTTPGGAVETFGGLKDSSSYSIDTYWSSKDKAPKAELVAPYKGFDFSKTDTTKDTFWSRHIYGSDPKKILSSIQSIAQDVNHPGQKEAFAFMKASDRKSRAASLSELLRKYPDAFPQGAWERLVHDSDKYNVILDYAASTQTAEIKVPKTLDYAKASISGPVEEVLGKTQLSAFQGLQTIGKVVELGEAVSQKQVDKLTIDRYLEKEPLLKQLVGDRSGTEAFDYLNKVQSTIRGSGMAARGVYANKLGDIDKISASSITDPIVKKKLQSATSKSERERILLSYVNSVVGPGQKISPGRDLTFEENAGFMAPDIRASLESAENIKNVAGSAVNYSQFGEISKAFDAPIKKFSESVEIFAKAVGHPRTGGSSPSVQSSESPNVPDRREMPVGRALLKMLETSR